MNASLFIAKLMGPCCLVMGLGLFLNPDNYQKILKEFCASAAATFFGGIMSMVLGILIVLNHNIWVFNWNVIITLYGWGGIIKGIWMVVFPKSVPCVTDACTKNKCLMLVQCGFVVLIGLVFTYFGYFG